MSESELTALTVAQLKELAAEYGLTLTETTKANIIAEILEALYPSRAEALTLGDLELTPDFDSDTTSYAAATTDAKNKLSVTPVSGNAEVTVKLNDAAVTAGTDGKYELTWSAENDGVNTVTVKLENGYEGEVYTTYTITVTAS